MSTKGSEEGQQKVSQRQCLYLNGELGVARPNDQNLRVVSAAAAASHQQDRKESRLFSCSKAVPFF